MAAAAAATAAADVEEAANIAACWVAFEADADAATALKSMSNAPPVVLPTSEAVASSPKVMRRACMASGSSRCRPGLTFSFREPVDGAGDGADDDDEAEACCCCCS